VLMWLKENFFLDAPVISLEEDLWLLAVRECVPVVLGCHDDDVSVYVCVFSGCLL